MVFWAKTVKAPKVKAANENNWMKFVQQAKSNLNKREAEFQAIPVETFSLTNENKMQIERAKYRSEMRKNNNSKRTERLKLAREAAAKLAATQKHGGRRKARRATRKARRASRKARRATRKARRATRKGT